MQKAESMRRSRQRFGVRWQSEAATPLSLCTEGQRSVVAPIQSGVAASLCHRTPKGNIEIREVFIGMAQSSFVTRKNRADAALSHGQDQEWVVDSAVSGSEMGCQISESGSTARSTT